MLVVAGSALRPTSMGYIGVFVTDRIRRCVKHVLTATLPIKDRTTLAQSCWLCKHGGDGEALSRTSLSACCILVRTSMSRSCRLSHACQFTQGQLNSPGPGSVRPRKWWAASPWGPLVITRVQEAIQMQGAQGGSLVPCKNSGLLLSAAQVCCVKLCGAACRGCAVHERRACHSQRTSRLLKDPKLQSLLHGTMSQLSRGWPNRIRQAKSGQQIICRRLTRSPDCSVLRRQRTPQAVFSHSNNLLLSIHVLLLFGNCKLQQKTRTYFLPQAGDVDDYVNKYRATIDRSWPLPF